MFYDRFSEKNELILLGHMCNIKIKIDQLSEFFKFLEAHNIRASTLCSLLRGYYYVSLYFPSKERSEEVFNVLLNWNP